MKPQFIVMLIVAAVVMAVAAPLALATSFIQECQFDDYRTNESDVVFHGTVTGFRNRGLVDGYGEITFTVESVEKGAVDGEFVLTQPGRTDGHGMIPAMTLEWAEGDTWKIQARQVPEGSDGLEGVEAGDYQLVCGAMGRTQIMESLPPRGGEMCAQVITMARDPETDEFREFPTPCDVPEGWETILPVEPDGGIGDGAVPPPAMCAQVITFAVNPETQAVTSFPTPCDVPAGWEVVDEPIPVEPDGGIGDGAEPLPIEGPGGIGDSPSLWQRFTRWLGGLF